MIESVKFKVGSKTFKEFSSSYKDRLIVKFMRAINLVTQNEPEQFFEYFLKSATGRTYILPALYEGKVKPLMETISDHYETAAQVHRLTILSMVANHFHFDELVGFGFPITKSQHESARVKDKKKSRSTKPVIKPVAPKNKLPDSTLVKIIEYCLENSKKSKNKKIHPSSVKHLDIPGYDIKKNYDLNETKKDIYASFKNKHPELKVSLTSFYKFIPQNFIAPRLPNSTSFKPNVSRERKEKLLSKPTKELPPTNLNHPSNQGNDLVTQPPPTNPDYSNSVNDMIAQPPNPTYSNSINDITIPQPPIQSNYPNPTNDMVYPPPPSNPYNLNSANGMVFPPPSSSDPNQLNSTGDMGLQQQQQPPPPPANQNYSNQSNSYMANPSDPSSFYHPNLTFDAQRPS